MKPVLFPPADPELREAFDRAWAAWEAWAKQARGEKPAPSAARSDRAHERLPFVQ